MNYDIIDNYIKDFTLHNEVNSYINTGKLPDYFCNNHNTYYTLKHQNLYKPLEYENIEHTSTTENDTQLCITKLYDNIQKCKHLEVELNNYQNDEQPNEQPNEQLNEQPNEQPNEQLETNANMCPICLENIQINNSVNPPCNHSLCIKCFAMNITIGANGHQCPICRSNLYP